MFLRKSYKLFFLTVSVFTPYGLLLAQNKEYQLLTPIPTFGSTYTPGLFVNYVQSFVTLSITLAAVLAVAFITIGGFQWMGGESLQMKADGKSKIQNAVLGLVILGASFLILNTINPALLNFKLEVPAILNDQLPTTQSQQASYSANDLAGVGEQIRTQATQNPDQPVTIPVRTGSADEQYNVASQCRVNKPGSSYAERDPTGRFYTCR